MIEAHRLTLLAAILLVMRFAACPLLGQETVVPIAASSPHVFMSLTEERDIDDASFFSVPNAPPKEPGLPENGSDHYEVAILDTGAPATIINHEAFEAFDITGSNRDGLNITPLGGVGPTIDAINSDPLGVYAVGFDGLITNPNTGAQIIDRSQLKGTMNDSILYGPSGTELPNLIGTTTSSHYATVINYGDPRIIEYGGETYRSPAVSILAFGDIAAPSRRIGLTVVPGQLGQFPAFLPDFGNLSLDDLGDNPSTPTIAGSFWLRANVSNNGVVRNQLEAILDTGAQGSFVSEQIAAEMGFDVVRDKPDFVVRISGVTGVSEEVPGFYADEFVLPGTDGGLRLENVPLIVFNLTDPRDGINTLDALIGMNLFSNRDVILNPEPGNSYLGLSDPAQPIHSWTSASSTATWSSPSNWKSPGVPNVGWYADVQNVTGVPQVANVQTDATVGMLVTKGSENSPAGTITVSIDEGKTMTVFGSAIIQDGSTLHLDDAHVAPLAVEVRGGVLSGSGTIDGEVLSQGSIRPGGRHATGTLHFLGSLDQLSDGVLEVELSDRESQNFDRLEVIGTMTLNGGLAIWTMDDYVEPVRGEANGFAIINADEQVLGTFAEYSFNGTPIGIDCTTDGRNRCTSFLSDPRAFRDHVSEGQFVGVAYPNPNTVMVKDYWAFEGDIDGDGEVQFDDFIVLAQNFGRPGNWRSGDFDGDGFVGFSDFLHLSDNFGKTSRTSIESVTAASIPEPTAGLLVGLGGLAIFSFRRRR